MALLRNLGLAVLFFANLVQTLAAQERVALVVGNSAYQHVTTLRNPKNDAQDLTARLESLGFTVIGGTDLDRRSLVEALIKFGRAAEKAEVALFFYAGHGLQVNGQNYLVPIDAMVEFESEIDLSLVSLSGVMQQLERGSRTNIVFLDACRDNPFAKELSRSMGNRSAVALKGLGRIQSGSGTFIAFATQPDAVAADGSGRNSPFTTALLAHIDAPGQSISDLMIDVRNDVIASTNGAQVPWDSSSLTGRFFFAPQTAGDDGDEPAAAQSNQVHDSGIESDAYDQAVDVGSCGAYEAFIRRYPDSFYAELAKERSLTACAAPSSQQMASAPVLSATRAPAKAGTCETGPFDIDYCASSVLKPIKANRYEPSMMFDGLRETAWVEGDKQDGVGETLTLHFGRERTLAGFEIINGYDKDQRTWANNSRIKMLEAVAANSPRLTIQLQDVRGPSRVDFNPPLKTSFLELQISEIYPGAKYRDTAISELYPIFSD